MKAHENIKVKTGVHLDPKMLKMLEPQDTCQVKLPTPYGTSVRERRMLLSTDESRWRSDQCYDITSDNAGFGGCPCVVSSYCGPIFHHCGDEIFVSLD